jgi:TPP-dependent pyruvate/acetoin dehydrogenase alpha subunit
MEAAAKPDAPKIMADAKRMNSRIKEPNVILTEERKTVDVEKGFAEADKIIEYTIHRAMNSPAGVEAIVCVAQWRNDYLDRWVHHQANPQSNLSSPGMGMSGSGGTVNATLQLAIAARELKQKILESAAMTGTAIIASMRWLSGRILAGKGIVSPDLCIYGRYPLDLDKRTLIDLYTTMVTIRRFEERVVGEFNAGNLVGFVHSYIGQEAIAAGVCKHLSKEDRIVSHHRGHGHCIAKGADMKKMMAEIYGKKTGYCKGKGGSMHIADFSIGMLGADGIVAAGLPIATGAAIAAQLERKGKIAAVFFGDGACQEGEFHEALNIAAIWKLPLLFVCENNQYGVNTPSDYALAAKDITRMPEAYHIANKAIYGNEVETVYQAAEEAVGMLRRGDGPYFLECKTYRWHKHFLSNVLEDLRPKEELEAWKKKCPVAAFEARLLHQGILTRPDVESINEGILAQVEEACRYAIDSPYPQPQDALEDVYSA